MLLSPLRRYAPAASELLLHLPQRWRLFTRVSFELFQPPILRFLRAIASSRHAASYDILRRRLFDSALLFTLRMLLMPPFC